MVTIVSHFITHFVLTLLLDMCIDIHICFCLSEAFRLGRPYNPPWSFSSVFPAEFEAEYERPTLQLSFPFQFHQIRVPQV